MPLAPEVRQLFERPNYAHLATLMPDGSPHSVAVWVGIEDAHIVIFTGLPDSRKARNLATDPRLAISVVDYENPYRTAQVRGRVVGTRHGDEALAVMDRIAVSYTGAPFPWRTPDGTLYLIEPEWSRYAELPFDHRPG